MPSGVNTISGSKFPKRLGSGLESLSKSTTVSENHRFRCNFVTFCASSWAVRDAYRRLRPLEELRVEKRGWTLDVLRVVQSLNKTEFELADVYAHAGALAKLHPHPEASGRAHQRQNPAAIAGASRPGAPRISRRRELSAGLIPFWGNATEHSRGPRTPQA